MIAYRGCANTVKRSALIADSGTKIPCHTRESNQHQQCVRSDTQQLSYIPVPHLHIISVVSMVLISSDLLMPMKLVTST